ncbi:MAG: hypothetical protein MEQ07_09885 [Aquimonas sp.]|nr:hypothetical protein [Aquimonas sp.]
MAEQRFSLLRTLALSLVLAAPVGVVLYLEREFRPGAKVGGGEALLPKPWLELPKQPQQLASPHTRRSLMDFLIMERTIASTAVAPNQDLYESLAFDCDEGYRTQKIDVVQLWLISAFGDGAKLELRVRGQLADLELAEWTALAAPEPPRSATVDELAQERSSIPRLKSRQLRGVPLERLETVRSAWASEALWTESRSNHTPGCMDGDTAIVSGCVQGEFAVQVHYCGSTAQGAAHRVMDAVKPLLADAHRLK